MEKNVEKFGEINLNTLLGSLALSSFSLASLLLCSQILSSPLGTGASMDLGLGLSWGLFGVVLGLGLF